MTAKPYLIANIRTGLERDIQPWILPNDAFPNLEDCFMFRGRIERRKGLEFLGRLVTTVGMVSTINNLPVMGLRTRDLDTPNVDQLIAFDTIKANVFSNVAQAFQDISFYKTTGTAFSWTGGNSDFFWTTNYLSAFWATNGTKGFQNNPTATTALSGDGIRWYDGTAWVNFLPNLNNAHTTKLMGCKILVSYRNRLVALNTIEGTAIGAPAQQNFYQRARWCQNGTPYQTAAFPVGQSGDDDAWNSEMVGKGGFIDAPTGQAIISAEFYKDTLIVFFERSTWQLRYTGNETLPFIWERINVDFGGESTFSIVPFDAGIVAVGNYGIVSCDATGVKRIDQKIPDEVFNFHNGNDGPKRVYGIRDFTRQLVYWTFPNSTNNPTFPNKVLVFNYLDQSYSIFNDSLTCFGTYQPFNDTTWQFVPIKWEDYANAWNAGVLQSGYPQIVAGNQQGFVFNNYNQGDISNDPSLAISNVSQADPAIITSINHNLSSGTIITISTVVGMTELNGNQYRVSTPISTNSFAIQSLDTNGNWTNVDSTSFTPYSSAGLIQVRNNFNILTKTFNPFIEVGDQVRLQWVDLYLEEATTTQFTMNVYLDENNNSAVEFDFIAPVSATLNKVWERAYVSAIGQFCQLEFKFDDEQMVDDTMSDGDVVVHAMMLWMSDAGRLTYGTIV